MDSNPELQKKFGTITKTNLGTEQQGPKIKPRSLIN